MAILLLGMIVWIAAEPVLLGVLALIAEFEQARGTNRLDRASRPTRGRRWEQGEGASKAA